MIGINKTIRTLIFSDLLLYSGWGLIGPTFAIFLTQQIRGGNLTTVGFAAAVFWLIKSILQPFIAHHFDIKKGEEDDFNALVRGFYVANLIPLGYFFSSQIWHIFLLEFIRGIAMAYVVPSWMAIFTRHINKGWEAFSWSVHSTAIGFSIGLAAAFGGIIATFLGFKIVFILITGFGLISTTLLFLIKKDLLPSDRFAVKIQPKEPLSKEPLL